jgi:quercetin dioxygenase-like cupin family protein
VTGLIAADATARCHEPASDHTLAVARFTLDRVPLCRDARPARASVAGPLVAGPSQDGRAGPVFVRRICRELTVAVLRAASARAAYDLEDQPLPDVSSIAPIWTGVIARALKGEQLTFAVIELEANAHVPEHQHDHEQLGILVHGSMTFRIGDEKQGTTPGSTWQIPPNVPHEAWTGAEGAVAVEVFAPRRADWDQFEPQPPTAQRWPA